jgi:hypothetical protein
MLPSVHHFAYAGDRNVIQVELFGAVKTRDESHFFSRPKGYRVQVFHLLWTVSYNTKPTKSRYWRDKVTLTQFEFLISLP